MGAELSTIPLKKIPDYFVEGPPTDSNRIYMLERSLAVIIFGPRCTENKNERLPFLKFYDAFFEKIEILEEENQYEFRKHFEYDVEYQSLFLAQFLKLIVSAPKQALLSKKKGKWNPEARKQLKLFVSDNRMLGVNCFHPFGLALLFAIEECDETCTSVLRRYWTEAYSLLLAQIIPKSRLKQKQRQPVDLRKVVLAKNLRLRLSGADFRAREANDEAVHAFGTQSAPPSGATSPRAFSHKRFKFWKDSPVETQTPDISPFSTPESSPECSPESSPDSSRRVSRSSSQGPGEERQFKSKRTSFSIELWTKESPQSPPVARGRAFTSPLSAMDEVINMRALGEDVARHVTENRDSDSDSMSYSSEEKSSSSSFSSPESICSDGYEIELRESLSLPPALVSPTLVSAFSPPTLNMERRARATSHVQQSPESLKSLTMDDFALHQSAHARRNRTGRSKNQTFRSPQIRLSPKNVFRSLKQSLCEAKVET